MKKIILLSFLAIICSTTGCKKFLDKVPSSFVAPENYFNNEKEVNTALNGVYDILSREQIFGGQLPIRHAVSTDESFFSYASFPTGPFYYNFGADDATIRDLWRYLYDGIERANVLLANLDKANMDEGKRSVVKGETLFLRAFYYFTLVQNWGGVPLKLTPTTSINNVNIPRNSVKEVYDQILKDMIEAEGLVKKISEIGSGGRVSKSAVRGILARVCLNMSGYPLNEVGRYKDAATWAAKVNEFGEHSLNPDYSQVFINLCKDQYDIKESIFEAELFGSNNDAFREGGRIGNENGVKCSASTDLIPTVGFAYGFVSTTRKLYMSYEYNASDATKRDLRRDWAIATYTLNASGVKANIAATNIYARNCAKWRREYEVVSPKNKNYTPTNFQILRYADVLLMLAEAENEVNNGPNAIAVNALNEVRRRGYGKLLAGATNPANADYPGAISLSKASFLKVIQDERARELCFEGLRKSDLIRWGIFVSTMQATATEFTTYASMTTTIYKNARDAAQRVTAIYQLYPIPILEMSLNKAMVQNEGY
ncbi:RagB/SusD family nutrient uptake outer membrane protein [Pedobacter heparinus]|uniref:RagB/SusD family nutrient uptake outer membrane protein n=1 Tax=Pedobacter heparinus TaxID=984 RepID=UPI00292CFA04|nr:RagB/SusD family nutrient uptake outer membrane protein [Pedobacter heparinus]